MGPTNVKARRAILLCKFHFSTATATIKLPRNSINVSWNSKQNQYCYVYYKSSMCLSYLLEMQLQLHCYRVVAWYKQGFNDNWKLHWIMNGIVINMHKTVCLHLSFQVLKQLMHVLSYYTRNDFCTFAKLWNCIFWFGSTDFFVSNSIWIFCLKHLTLTFYFSIFPPCVLLRDVGSLIQCYVIIIS